MRLMDLPYAPTQSSSLRRHCLLAAAGRFLPAWRGTQRFAALVLVLGKNDNIVVFCSRYDDGICLISQIEIFLHICADVGLFCDGDIHGGSPSGQMIYVRNFVCSFVLIFVLDFVRIG